MSKNDYFVKKCLHISKKSSTFAAENKLRKLRYADCALL